MGIFSQIKRERERKGGREREGENYNNTFKVMNGLLNGLWAVYGIGYILCSMINIYAYIHNKLGQVQEIKASI